MSKLRRFLAASLIVSVAAAGMPAQAGRLPTESALAGKSAARERIATLLERRDVRTQLEAYGVNAAAVQARVAALTDDEAAQLAGERIHRAETIELYAFDRELIAGLVARLERRMAFDLSVTDAHLFVSMEGATLSGEVERLALA